MIPKVTPPLTGLTVLVTRPEPQCHALCTAIEHNGGGAIALPAIAVQPLDSHPIGHADLVVFVSANAVEHGARLVTRGPQTRIAAIGRATAAALAAAQLPADIVPDERFDSEALLSHEALAQTPPARIVIVRGEGGRELLRETFAARGAQVETREVYRRVRPAPDPDRLKRIETQWAEDGVDVVTITSVQTLEHLLAMLSEAGRALLLDATLLVASRRIMEAARPLGLRGDILLARGADDASMIAALARWQARARAG